MTNLTIIYIIIMLGSINTAVWYCYFELVKIRKEK